MLGIVQNYWASFKKIGPISENSSLPLVSQAGYGPGSHTSIFTSAPLTASKNFWIKVQLSTKSDAFSLTNILLSLILFFNLLHSISKVSLPRCSRVSYKKLNGWGFGHWLTANFMFSAVTWKNIVWSFSMPLWCNKHVPGQSASIIIAFHYSRNLYTLDCDSTSSGRHNLHYGNINLTYFMGHLTR